MLITIGIVWLKLKGKIRRGGTCNRHLSSSARHKLAYTQSKEHCQVLLQRKQQPYTILGQLKVLLRLECITRITGMVVEHFAAGTALWNYRSLSIESPHIHMKEICIFYVIPVSIGDWWHLNIIPSLHSAATRSSNTSICSCMLLRTREFWLLFCRYTMRHTTRIRMSNTAPTERPIINCLDSVPTLVLDAYSR